MHDVHVTSVLKYIIVRIKTFSFASSQKENENGAEENVILQKIVSDDWQASNTA